jgi:TfoX/Sxy family transcriptional regulator of competence genes
MAYNEKLADRIREALAPVPEATEKNMFGGVCFMVDDKMCMGVVKDDLMCRTDPAVYEELLEKQGSRPMDFTGRPMKGYIFVSEEGLKTKKDLMFWVERCLAYNKQAKASKKPKKKTGG